MQRDVARTLTRATPTRISSGFWGLATTTGATLCPLASHAGQPGIGSRISRTVAHQRGRRRGDQEQGQGQNKSNDTTTNSVLCKTCVHLDFPPCEWIEAHRVRGIPTAGAARATPRLSTCSVVRCGGRRVRRFPGAAFAALIHACVPSIAAGLCIRCVAWLHPVQRAQSLEEIAQRAMRLCHATSLKP